MKNQDLQQLFVDELKDMYSAEVQIVGALPRLNKLASLPELKEALADHLQETKQQVERIEQIFVLLGVGTFKETCEGMRGLLAESDKLTANKDKSLALDAAIISAAQKVEHYEIASYGTLKSFAKHLDLDSDILNLLKDNYNEEVAADKKLTKIAEGSFFSSGLNQKAAACCEHQTVS